MDVSTGDVLLDYMYRGAVHAISTLGPKDLMHTRLQRHQAARADFVDAIGEVIIAPS
jgi:hypothetical protein